MARKKKRKKTKKTISKEKIGGTEKQGKPQTESKARE